MSAESTRKDGTKMADISSPTSNGLLSHKCCSDLFAKGGGDAIAVIADGNPEKTHSTKHPEQSVQYWWATPDIPFCVLGRGGFHVRHCLKIKRELFHRNIIMNCSRQ